MNFGRVTNTIGHASLNLLCTIYDKNIVYSMMQRSNSCKMQIQYQKQMIANTAVSASWPREP